MSLTFPIPDWGDEAFHYPGVNISGDITIKRKSKNKKRKHDGGGGGGDGMLEKDQPGNSEAAPPQQATKKKKMGKIEKGKNTLTTEISSHQEDNSNITPKHEAGVETNVLPSKRKKNRKNNKYKELNQKQKEERIAQGGSTSEKCLESKQQDMTVKGKQEDIMTVKGKQQDIMTVKSKQEDIMTVKGKQVTQASEESQCKQTKEVIKKKKKKSKVKEHIDSSVSQETNMINQNNNSTDTSHTNANQELKLVNSHGNKMNSSDVPATDVDVKKKKKKKKSTNKASETLLSNGNETQACLESDSHQNASNGNVQKKKEIKATKNGEGSGEKNGLGSSVSIPKSEEMKAEEGTKKKKKENSNSMKGKDNVSKSKKAKLEKQKKPGKSSKKVKESDDAEELVFDGDEECSEGFKKDLGALLSSLNFSQPKTPASGKGTSNDDDDDITELDMNNQEEMSQPKKQKDKKRERKKKGLKEKKEKTENAKPNHKKITNGQDTNDHQPPKTPVKKGAKFNKEKVARLLEEAAKIQIQREKPTPPPDPIDTLKQRMEGRLMAARFRMVNQELYTKSSSEAQQLFKKDPSAFDVYHKGYQAQVRHWPVNPLDLIVKWLNKKPKEWVVADMGCGEATLAQRVPQTCVHSLDLVAAHPEVTACDMAHTPLAAASVDVVVFCLSLMGTNLKDFMVETNRILRAGGIMKIAEVESRFEDVKEFEKHLDKYGFHCTARDTSQKYFFVFDFKKTQKLKKTATLPNIFLKPCLYKKR